MSSMLIYLTASLPMLEWDAEPRLSARALLERCAQWLKPEDARELAHVFENEPSAFENPVLRKWWMLETEVRNAVARLRAARLRVDANAHLRPCPSFSVFIEHAVGEAMAKSNPLERETSLDRLRWLLADELALEEPFGLSAVVAYAAKLKIAERRHAMQTEKGQAALDKQIKRLTENAA